VPQHTRVQWTKSGKDLKITMKEYRLPQPPLRKRKPARVYSSFKYYQVVPTFRRYLPSADSVCAGQSFFNVSTKMVFERLLRAFMVKFPFYNENDTPDL